MKLPSYSDNTGGYTTYLDPITIHKITEKSQERMFREQQKAYEEMCYANREAKFRKSMEFLIHRVAQLESQTSQLTHRLSKAEAEVRSAKGRERKLLPLIRSLVVVAATEGIPDRCCTIIYDLEEEFRDANKETSE